MLRCAKLLRTAIALSSNLRCNLNSIFKQLFNIPASLNVNMILDTILGKISNLSFKLSFDTICKLSFNRVSSIRFDSATNIIFDIISNLRSKRQSIMSGEEIKSFEILCIGNLITFGEGIHNLEFLCCLTCIHKWLCHVRK